MAAKPPKHPSSNFGYRPDIQGLRAIAVLAVVGFDCRIPWLRGGFIGIDLLFVICGYSICSLIYKEVQARSFNIARFYEQGLKRILPVLSVVLLFCLCLAGLVLSPWEAYRLGQSAVATSLSASNFLFIFRTSYFADRALTNPLLMTWAVGVGVQFCIAFALLMLSLRNRTRQSIILCFATLSVLSFLASVYAEFRYPIWNFYLPLTRAWEFGAGAMLAVWQAGKASLRSQTSWQTDAISGAGLLMIAGSMILYRPDMRFPGYEAVLPVLGAVLILRSPHGRANRMLAVRPAVAIGLISYALYLWHWPLLSFAEILSSKPLQPQTTGMLMAIAFVASIGSYFLVEKPLRARSEASTSRVLFSYGALIAFLVFLSGAFYVTKGLPFRNPDLYAIENRAALYRHYPCISAGSYLRMSPQCVPSPSSSLPAMAVLGGGHAEAVAEGLRDFASASKWQLVTLTRESCPPTKGFSQWSPSDSTLADSCRRFNQSALDYVLGRPDIRVVVLVGRWRAGLVPDGYAGDPSKQSAEQNLDNLRRGLTSEVAVLESAGKQVIVVEDVPEFPYDPVEGVRNQHIPLRRNLNRALLSKDLEDGDGSSEKRSVAFTAVDELANEQVVAVKAADPNLTLIDPKAVLCRGDRCYFAKGPELFYVDSIHLSRNGAMQVASMMPKLNATQNGIPRKQQ